MKKIYIRMAADIIHPGHIRMITEASKLGEVTVGLLTDTAISQYKKLPYMTYEQRAVVVNNLQEVSTVIPQKTISYVDNILDVRPDFVVHSDSWEEGVNSLYIKNELLRALNEYGGELVEIPYESGFGTDVMNELKSKLSSTPSIRLAMLRRLLDSKKLIRVNECHSGLSGLITENMVEQRDGDRVEFDAMWSSSLTDSTSKGMPDIEAVDMTSRLTTVDQIFSVTTKPMIFDADTGGKIEHFVFTVRSLERLGVSAVVIEDKIGLKKNSLLGNDVKQTQDTVDGFCSKIMAGKESQVTDDFMIIARIESLILEAGMDDAIHRANSYADAGADVIMIHSRHKNPDEIFEFCRRYKEESFGKPLMVVPSSFNTVTEDEWIQQGVNIVCYANHMLRSAFPAMESTARSILKNGRSYESSENCLSIKEIMKLIPGTI